MVYYIISAGVIFLACTIGATVGFGGGVIIKPILDAIGFCTVDTVNLISSFAVFAMSISSIIRHKMQKTKFDLKIALPISIGAMLGGIMGSRLFSLILTQISNDLIKTIQGVLIVLFVGFAVFYVNQKAPKTFHFSSPVVIFCFGLILGTLNSFLGIGGGPINATFLLLMFSLTVKQGAVYSLCIVFFCQLSNLASVFLSNHFVPYKEYAPLIILGMICAVAGGLLGSTLNKKFNEKTVKIVFSLVMIFVFSINMYNIVKGIV